MTATPVHASTAAFTHIGLGTVRTCPPLPIRSTMTQCSSHCWINSRVRARSSPRRSPQRIHIAEYWRSWDLRACAGEAVRRVAYEAADAGLLSPELAAGIRRVKGVRRIGVLASRRHSPHRCSHGRPAYRANRNSRSSRPARLLWHIPVPRKPPRFRTAIPGRAARETATARKKRSDSLKASATRPTTQRRAFKTFVGFFRSRHVFARSG
jgi:hypothetical protein